MLAALWMTNPPQSVDGPILDELAEVGLKPGSPYDLSQQPQAIQVGMNAAARAALKYISSDVALAQTGNTQANGWTLTTGFDGQWGTNYLNRAVTAYNGLGANAAQDAVYGYANRDHTGLLLNGANRYTITFPGDEGDYWVQIAALGFATRRFEVKRTGVVRRAKLYYLRDRVGKATRLRERKPKVSGDGAARKAGKGKKAEAPAEQSAP